MWNCASLPKCPSLFFHGLIAVLALYFELSPEEMKEIIQSASCVIFFSFGIPEMSWPALNPFKLKCHSGEVSVLVLLRAAGWL